MKRIFPYSLREGIKKRWGGNPDEADIKDLVKVFDSETAYHWALFMGDRDLMRDLVVDDYWVCRWIRNIGDEGIMRPRIKHKVYLELLERRW